MKEKCYKKSQKERKIQRMKFQTELKQLPKQKKSLLNLKKKKKKNLGKIENQIYKLNKLKLISSKFLNSNNDQVPQVMSYAFQKKEEEDLLYDLKNLKRKIEITQL